MARVAFIMDRIFRRFGLSGKSFIPFLIGSGCGVPGIMATRTIENEKDRRMTMMTVTNIPCGAKLPVIALIAGYLLNGCWWLAPLMYFVGIIVVIVSCIILKKTSLFAGDPAPFVMELPQYHIPSLKGVLLHVESMGIPQEGRNNPLPMLCSYVVPRNIRYPERNIWYGRYRILFPCFNRWSYRLDFQTTRIWNMAGSSIITLRLCGKKKGIVSTMGVLSGLGEVEEYAVSMHDQFAAFFPTTMVAVSFLMFNLV